MARAADPADTPTSLKELLLLIMLVRLIWWSNLNYDTCTVHAYFVVIDNNYNDTYVCIDRESDFAYCIRSDELRVHFFKVKYFWPHVSCKGTLSKCKRQGTKIARFIPIAENISSGQLIDILKSRMWYVAHLHNLHRIDPCWCFLYVYVECTYLLVVSFLE